jgi:alcohol dehydrogenase class IV
MDNTNFLNLRKLLVPEIIYGAGSIELSGRHALNFGASKALVVTGSGPTVMACANLVIRLPA